MERIFSGKVVIITGGSSGIGQATAVAFAKRGAKVVIADYHNGSETIRLMEDEGVEGTFIKCDVQNELDVYNLIEQTIKQYGRLDYAINNAGVIGPQAATQDVTIDEWERIVGINLKGVWLCMKHEIPELLKTGKGAIVNTASIAGLVAFANMAPYVASKHGVIGLTKTAAMENAKTGIRINAVCPGAIRTPMIGQSITAMDEAEHAYTNIIPMGRLGNPEEIADFIVFLCSDAATYITGQAMVADGGWTVQ